MSGWISHACLVPLCQICVGAVQRPLLADLWPCNPGPALVSPGSLCGAEPALQFHHEHAVTPTDKPSRTRTGNREGDAPVGSKPKSITAAVDWESCDLRPSATQEGWSPLMSEKTDGERQGHKEEPEAKRDVPRYRASASRRPDGRSFVFEESL